MRLTRFLARVGALAIVMTMAFAAPLFAADAVTVDLSPIAGLVREYAVVGVDAAIVAVIGWGIRLLHLSGNNQAAQFADQLRQFLHDTADRALDRALALIPTNQIGVRSEVLASALNYVLANATDAVKRLGASPDDLKRLLEAKLGGRQLAEDPAPVPPAAPS